MRIFQFSSSSKNEDYEIYVQFGIRRMPLKTMDFNLLYRKLKFCEHTKIRSKQEINKNTNHKKTFRA